MAEKYENIKDRMFRNAARMWGVSPHEQEAAFDPLVGLLLEACAAEVEGLSREISNSHLRVTQKLIELMSPGIGSGIYPSHAIAKSQPAEHLADISPETSFICKPDPLSYRTKKQPETLFVPSGNYLLFDASVEFFVYRDKLYHTEADLLGRRNVQAANLNIPSNPLQLWICIKANPKISNFKGMSLYFNLSGNEERKSFVNLLDQAEWSLNGTPIRVNRGMPDCGYQQAILEKKLEGGRALFEECMSEINSYYNSNFRTITDAPEINLITTNNTGPGISREQLAVYGLKPEETHWICIGFKQSPRIEAVSNLECLLNTFPVVNIIERNIQLKAREHFNLVPLYVGDDYFFDIKKIEDSSGINYKENVSFVKSPEIQKSYVLRSEGVQSFDSRSAQELLATLLEKLKNENAAFHFLDLPSATEDIRTLYQLASKLETKIQKSPEFKRPMFAYIDGCTANDQICLTYRTTTGSAGNNITTESKLEILEGTIVKPGTTKFVTNTRGGLDKLPLDEQLNVYRKALLTRNRVITTEDLKAFVHAWFGNLLSNVEIKMGVTNINNGTKGLMRCIELHLTMAPTYTENEDSLMWCNDFLLNLKNNSSNTYPYKLFVNNKLIEV